MPVSGHYTRRHPPSTKSPTIEDALRAEQITAAVVGFVEGVKHILSTTDKARLMRSMTPKEAEYVVEQVLARYIVKRSEQELLEGPPSDPVDDLWTA